MKKFMALFLIIVIGAMIIPQLALAQEAPAEYYQIYRLYNSQAHDHLYTASWEESEKVQTMGFILEEKFGYLSTRQLLQNQTPFYRLYNKKTHKHFYIDNNDELADLVLHHDFVFEGTLGFLSNPSFATDQGRLFRLYNPANNDHLYTANWVEWGMLQLSGWRDEGSLQGKLYIK